MSNLVHVLCRVGSYANKTKAVAEKRCAFILLVTVKSMLPVQRVGNSACGF